jgi:aminopeptidase N
LVADLTLDEAIDRARAIDVESYDVFLDLTAEPVLSRTEVRFRWRRPDASTFAELRTQGVRSVTLDGVSLPPPEDGRLRLSRPGGGDQAVLVVEAEAGYSQEGRGLSRFTDPADGAGYVMACCYPDCGPELFCCFDQPDLIAAFRFAVRVPDGWECVANGELDRRQHGVYTFTAVSGMRPYDLTFCAGPFATAARTRAGRTEVTVRHRHSLLGQGAVASLPQFTDYARDAIAWYADRLGVACPYPAYDIVFVPDLAAMALSVPGLMVVNERLLGRPAGADDQRSAMICAHEVAHLWFGCLVGPRWWDDVWLDEAIATYLSYAALAAIAGVSESLSWTGFAYTDKPEAYAADDLPSRQPVSSPVAAARQGRDKPYGILYVKGASVIRSLAALIGDDALRQGMSDYLSRFAFGSATLDDLVGCWSRASGQELAGWAEQWLRAEGTTTIRSAGTGSGCWSPAVSCRPHSSRTWYADGCRQAACPRWASRRCSAAPSRRPTRGLRHASELAFGNRSPTRHGQRPETRGSSRSATPPARRLTVSSPRWTHGWPGKTCRAGSTSTRSCGRASCSRSRHAGWRARRTSTRCRNSTRSPAS